MFKVARTGKLKTGKSKLVCNLAITTALMTLSWAMLAAIACPCSEITQKTIDTAERPTNVQAGVAFSHTPEYQKQFSQAIEDAYAACKKHLGEKDVAIVSDIDETLLDNRDYYLDHDRHESKSFQVWVDSSSASTLKQTAEFLAWARKNGFAILLITGRHESERVVTIENLIRDGISYDALYMRVDGDKRPAEIVKTIYREQIEKMGFKVIENIGDQYSDLAGASSVDCEKLPNKMYFIP